MEYRVNGGGREIAYTLTRRKMKNIRIRVTGAGSVQVSAPHTEAAGRISAFVQENAKFILQKLDETEALRKKYYPVSYRTGDTFWYLGEVAPLTVVVSKKTKAVLEERGLKLYVPSDADYRYRKALFILWFERQADKVFTERAKEIFPMFRHLAKQNVHVSVKNMLTRWGSVNPRRHTISFSVHLLRCEPALIDYVIMHELCHFAHSNHSRAFYAELDAHCPNRKQMDKRLKEYGLVDF